MRRRALSPAARPRSSVGVRTRFIAGVALATGLWSLRAAQLNRSVAHTLIVAGLVVLGAGFWWFVLVPPVIALAVLYASVIKGGLERELRPS